MPPKFEFIEVEPSNTNASRDRRRIRSQAARAGGGGGSTMRIRPYHELSHRQRARRPIAWPLAVDGLDQVEDIDVTQAATLSQSSQIAALDTIPVAGEYMLMPFAGNASMMPISQSQLYPLPFLSLVLTNYIEHLTGAIPEIDGPTETNLLRKSWFPMVLHSKPLFQLIVLFSASHYATRQNSQVHAQDICFIKHCALRDLQEALRSDQGFDRDENIAAVGKMASYEAVFGTPEAHNVHMNGLERILRHRGGLQALGLNGFLARLLIFIDTNSAALLNQQPRLTEPHFPRQGPIIPPNLAKFVGSS